MIEECLGNGIGDNVNFTYILQEEPNGLAHAVLTASEFLQEDPFCMILGDNYIEEDLLPLRKRFEEICPEALISLKEVDNPSSFGIAELDGDKVINLIEKPKEPKSNLALVGLYFFDSIIRKAARNIAYSWRNELEITDAIQWLLDNEQKVIYHKIEMEWLDLGKGSSLLEANRLILDKSLSSSIGENTIYDSSDFSGRVAIGKNCNLVNSTFRGPCIIGDNCTITDSYVGPYSSIGDKCIIDNTEITNSILREGCGIYSADRIENSILGIGVEVTKTKIKPSAHKFFLSDNSKVELA